MFSRRRKLLALALLALTVPLALTGEEKKPNPALARSNENAQVLITVFSRFSPEGAGFRTSAATRV